MVRLELAARSRPHRQEGSGSALVAPSVATDQRVCPARKPLPGATANAATRTVHAASCRAAGALTPDSGPLRHASAVSIDASVAVIDASADTAIASVTIATAIAAAVAAATLVCSLGVPISLGLRDGVEHRPEGRLALHIAELRTQPSVPAAAQSKRAGHRARRADLAAVRAGPCGIGDRCAPVPSVLLKAVLALRAQQTSSFARAAI